MAESVAFKFSGPQVCRLTGVTYRQLDYWARTDLVTPSITPATGSGSKRALLLRRPARGQGHQVAARRRGVARARAPGGRVPALGPGGRPGVGQPRALRGRVGARPATTASSSTCCAAARASSTSCRSPAWSPNSRTILRESERREVGEGDRARRDRRVAGAREPRPAPERRVAAPRALRAPQRARSSRRSSTSTACEWRYEPIEFPLAWDDDGQPTRAFRPDFYVASADLYIELTVADQRLVTTKNRRSARSARSTPTCRSSSSTSATSPRCSSATPSGTAHRLRGLGFCRERPPPVRSTTRTSRSGPRWSPSAGWEMPLAYPTGTVAEHLACRHGRGRLRREPPRHGARRGPRDASTRCSDPDQRPRQDRAGPRAVHAPAHRGRLRASTTSSSGGSARSRFDVMPNASNTDAGARRAAAART